MILTLDNSKKKPRKIKQILPWPPSEGFMKEMEQGLITECSFAIPIVIKGKKKTHEEAMRDRENRRKL